ncbi:MAG: porin family protein [Tannerellaceae bacterium]|jgi:hypothetical protein|nr:porin family protein [Tannerellaceae bacterium]
MKNKMFIFMLLAAVYTFASAQTGEKSVGLSTGFNTDLGIEHPNWGIHFGYNFTDRFRIAPSFDYYAPAHNTVWDINLDAHYFLVTGNKFTVYPVVGASVLYRHNLKAGANLGAGVDYELSSHIALVLQAKYQFLIKHTDYILFSIGCNYLF